MLLPTPVLFTASTRVFLCELPHEMLSQSIRVRKLPIDENRIILCSFFSTQCQRVTDRQRNGHAAHS